MTLPNVIRGALYRLLMQPRTAAGASVSMITLPEKPSLPHILIRHDGGLPDASDNRASVARLTFEARARDWESALSLINEVRDRWRPGEEVVDGWTGTVELPAIQQRNIPTETVYFSGAQINAEPIYVPDEVTGTPRYTMPVLVNYS